MQCGVKYYKGRYPVFSPAIDCYSRKEIESPMTRRSWDWSLDFPHCALFFDWLEQMEEGGPGYSSIRIPAHVDEDVDMVGSQRETEKWKSCHRIFCICRMGKLEQNIVH